MRDLMITNNKFAKEAYENACEIIFTDVDMAGVLRLVRDYIHKGHGLLSHPLSGSVKPNENPYKSVLVSAKVGALDLDSLRIIENCIAAAQKFPLKYQNLTEEMRLDFQKVDYSLITSAFCNKI